MIACVHGNLPALEAVFADIDRREILRVVCLGDIIGYGPDPLACVERVFERCNTVIRGDCEDALPKSWKSWIDADLRAAMAHSVAQVGPSSLLDFAGRRRLRRLKALPWQIVEGERGFIHFAERGHSPAIDCTWPEFVSVDRDVFPRGRRIVFLGHLHQPGLEVTASQANDPLRLVAHSQHLLNVEPGTTHDLSKPERHVICVGGVGRSHDGDTRASWVEVLENEVTFHRVEYEVGETVAHMKAIRNFPTGLIEQLEAGQPGPEWPGQERGQIADCDWSS